MTQYLGVSRTRKPLMVNLIPHLRSAWLALLVACCACQPSHGQATVPYTQNFEGTIGSEWSATSTVSNLLTTTPWTTALGGLGNATITLTLATTPGVTYEARFDVIAIDSWDGSHATAGPDTFSAGANGTTILAGTIGALGNLPTFPGLADRNRANEGYGTSGTDRVYAQQIIRFTATAATSEVSFAGSGLSAGEVWAIDNVSVTVAPPLAPATVPYLADFEAGAGPEWSNRLVLSTTTHGKVLGNFFEAPEVTLTLNTTPGSTYRLFFDLWCVDNWDGTHATQGPDFFRVKIGGADIWAQTIGFTANNPSLAAVPETCVGDRGLGNATQTGANWADRLYRRQYADFTAVGSTTVISFAADLTASTNETWALDNVRIVPASSASAFTPTFSGLPFSAGMWRNPTNTTSSGLFWADFNSDGVSEMVQGGLSFLIRYDVGSGVWAGPAATSRGVPQTLADIDNNGRIDFWGVDSATKSSRGIEIDGAGTTAINRLISSATDPAFTWTGVLRAIAPLDANADGWIDFALMGDGGNALAINRGATNLGTLQQFVRGSLPSSVSDVGSGAWSATGDINNDTIPDIFWSVGSGRLWLSDGAGGFTAQGRGISVLNSGTTPAGAMFADIDNDRDLDLFVGRRGSGLAPTLWINTGTSFTEQAASRGLGSLRDVTDSTFGDYDNDGDLDMFFTMAVGYTGLAVNQGSSGGYNFTILDDGTVTESRGGDCSLFDFDNDGDLDFFYQAESSIIPTRQFRNNKNNGNQSLTVRVIGKGAGYINTAAIGTRVELWDATNTQFLQRRDVGLAKGAGGMTPLWVHFGGVNENTAYTLRVWGRGTIYSVPVTPAAASTTFTSGTRQRFYTFDENVHAPRVQVVQFREAMQGE